MSQKRRYPDGGGSAEHGGPAVELPPLRILCVEDLRAVAEAIGAAIDAEPGMRTIGILPTPETLARETRRLRPDVVLFDLYYGAGRPAFDDLAGLCAAAPQIAVIVISGDNHPATVERAFAAGAHGYVVKSDMREVIEAIRAVAAGGTWRPHDSRPHDIRAPEQPGAAAPARAETSGEGEKKAGGGAGGGGAGGRPRVWDDVLEIPDL